VYAVYVYVYAVFLPPHILYIKSYVSVRKFGDAEAPPLRLRDVPGPLYLIGGQARVVSERPGVSITLIVIRSIIRSISTSHVNLVVLG